MGVPKFVIEVWICPVCSNYFGSSSASRKQMETVQTDHHMSESFARVRCPDCFVLRGVEVDRVHCAFEVNLVAQETAD
jgi:hypothetical protein